MTANAFHNIAQIETSLWEAADQLRANSNLTATEYSMPVLGVIFLRHATNRYQTALQAIEAAQAAGTMPKRPLVKGDFIKRRALMLPEAARYDTLLNLPSGASLGGALVAAMNAIEADFAPLQGSLPKDYDRFDNKLLENLLRCFDSEALRQATGDVFGRIYEYFLMKFAMQGAQDNGEFFTPPSLVQTLVNIIEPDHGVVADLACGSGGMFVQSEKFIEAHGGKLGDVSIYGQEANPTTWRLAAMNLAIRGIDFNLGREPGDTFTRNQHKDLRADFILANPPFNISDWWHGSLEGDPRWQYGDPPQGNANYAWLQHMLHHLKPTGRAGIVLANGSMSSSQNNEGVIRAAMVDADVVEVMVALPGQLFFNTQIPACLWFLAKSKKRRGEVLFIDARKQARMISRVQAELDDDAIQRIAETVAAWRGEVEAGASITDYQDQPGFCRSVPLAEIAQHGHVLTPGRYVGAEEVEDDDEAFAEKMQKLTEKLGEQMAKGAELDALIRQKLGGLGYEF